MYLRSTLRCSVAHAVVGIGFIALTGCRVSESDRMHGAARQLQHRPLEARVYGSAYAPWWSGANVQGISVPDQDVLEIARRIRSKKPEELQARAALCAGKVHYARRLLERVTSHN